jgi:hypothetical protein
MTSFSKMMAGTKQVPFRRTLMMRARCRPGMRRHPLESRTKLGSRVAEMVQTGGYSGLRSGETTQHLPEVVD